jgi:TolB-like protein
LLYLFEDCALDTYRRELRRGGDPVAVEPQVFDLLVYLIRHRDRVVSKDELLASIWHGRMVSESAFFSRINAVRNAIADTGEQQRLIKTLPRKGLRFVGAVREEQASTGVTGGRVDPHTPALSVPDKPSIAVLPFINLSSDPEHEYLADGIVGDIITELSRFSELFVISRNSSFQYKGKAVDVRQAGRDLGARYVLEGTVRRSGDRLRVAAQLVDVRATCDLIRVTRLWRPRPWGWPTTCASSIRARCHCCAIAPLGHQTCEPPILGWLRPTRRWVSSARPGQRRPRCCDCTPVTRLLRQEGGSYRSRMGRTTNITLMGSAERAYRKDDPSLGLRNRGNLPRHGEPIV